MVTVNIDGKKLEVVEDTTILKAAEASGMDSDYVLF